MTAETSAAEETGSDRDRVPPRWSGGTTPAWWFTVFAGYVADGTPVLVAARERIKEREEGRRLAVKDPVLAREVGVGRPDLPGAEDYGLIDVNHAAPGALCQLPGITPQIAERIEQTRQSVGLFTSAEDLCVTLDLPPNLTDDLREHAVFL